MIECIHFDADMNQVDLPQFSAASFAPHILDPQTFQFRCASRDIKPGHFLTLVDGRKPLFTGLVDSVTESAGAVDVQGYDMRCVLDGMQYNIAKGLNPVACAVVNMSNVDFIADTVNAVFEFETVELQNAATPASYSTEIRLKSCLEALRDACISTGVFYALYVIGSQRIVLEIKPMRQRDNIVLLADVTHDEIAKKSALSYNQLLALGSGEGEDRDYVFIDQSGTARPRCYTYDIREDISHDVLTQRAQARMAELQLGEQYTMSLLHNSAYVFGQDYGMGDIVQFKTRDGDVISDMITAYTATVEGGQLKHNYEVTTGLGKGTLTQKLKELKEGGYK